MASFEQMQRDFNAFFVESETGADLLKRMGEAHKSNLSKAQDEESLKYLSRAKGNQELLNMIINVLKGEVKKK